MLHNYTVSDMKSNFERTAPLEDGESGLAGDGEIDTDIRILEWEGDMISHISNCMVCFFKIFLVVLAIRILKWAWRPTLDTHVS